MCLSESAKVRKKVRKIINHSHTIGGVSYRVVFRSKIEVVSRDNHCIALRTCVLESIRTASPILCLSFSRLISRFPSARRCIERRKRQRRDLATPERIRSRNHDSAGNCRG